VDDAKLFFPLGGIFDGKDFAEGHLLERKADFRFLRGIVEGGLSIIDEPIHLRIAVATQRRVAGNSEVVELNEHGVIPLDFETEDFDVEAPGCLNVCYVAW